MTCHVSCLETVVNLEKEQTCSSPSTRYPRVSHNRRRTGEPERVFVERRPPKNGTSNGFTWNFGESISVPNGRRAYVELPSCFIEDYQTKIWSDISLIESPYTHARCRRRSSELLPTQRVTMQARKMGEKQTMFVKHEIPNA